MIFILSSHQIIQGIAILNQALTIQNAFNPLNITWTAIFKKQFSTKASIERSCRQADH